MGMRVTTGMAMNLYRYNLQNSTSRLSSSANTIQTQRKFDSFAEDPSSAIQAWRIRRSMTDNANYQKANASTYSRFSIAWSTMAEVNEDLLRTDGEFSTIRGISGTAGAGRQPLGQVLDKSAETIINNMNSAKYSDHFVFAGDDEMNAPFSWSEDMKTLYYRGVNVNAGGVEKPAGADPYTLADWGEKDQFGVPANAKEIMDGTIKNADGTERPSTEEEKAWAAYYMDQGDVKKLDLMAAEEENVDLGMGLLEDENGNLINGTAFNRSLPGINMLGGYGLDEDGDPRNVVMIMKRLGEMLSSADPTSGAWDPDPEKAGELQQEAERLLTKLTNGMHRVTEAFTEVETKAHYLQNNQANLKLQGNYLNEERANLEDVDLADAITAFSWDYYCYSAALKVGTQLLTQSLIDYMN